MPAARLAPNAATTDAYRRLDERLKAGGAVILDGGIGSELQEVGYPPDPATRTKNYTWGSIAIREAPEKLVEVHRRYAEAGADVLETHTFALNRIWAASQDGRLDLPRDAWKSIALESVALVREGAAKAGRPNLAVAFACRTQDWPANQQEKAHDYEGYYEALDRGYLATLAETLATADPDHTPDLILMEIQNWIPKDLEFPDYQLFLDTGIPLWVSYRRNHTGVVGVEGEPIIQDGDRFGRAAAKFEDMGITAVLVNCLPPEHVAGTFAWLRQYTRLPLGVYPNAGTYLDYEWDFSTCPTPAEMAAYARAWVDEGAQIIGGCCGVQPASIRAMAEAIREPAGVE
jgi:S-methylmethionine-dependent homocysteine/selenocysteine methylase